MRHRDGTGGRRAAAALVVALAAVVPSVGACGGDDGGSRLEEVAERGAAVMPFDLDATTHRFEPTATGLEQTVVADDPGDGEQVALIRQHLADEAERFRAGDYGDPAAIHGDDMPGLVELEAGAAAVEVELGDLDDGARLTFTSADPTLVDALHRWAAAQTMDHGDHAGAADPSVGG